MYRKFDNPIPPKTKISIARREKELLEPPRVGDIVTFKAAELIFFGILVEQVGSESIKGEVAILGGAEIQGSPYECYNDWELRDKIEIDIDKLDGIIKKNKTA